MNYQKFYWLAFNTAGKIFGLGLFLIAGVICFYLTSQLLGGNINITINGYETGAAGLKIGIAIGTGILSLLGLLMIIVKPFRPDLPNQ